MNRSSETDVAAQLARYEELAVAWDSETNPRVANKLFGQLHAIALLMRHVEEGRFGLEALLDHPNRGVRLSAAGDCLAWGSEAAITGLEWLP
jgi:hypothetical protein